MNGTPRMQSTAADDDATQVDLADGDGAEPRSGSTATSATEIIAPEAVTAELAEIDRPWRRAVLVGLTVFLASRAAVAAITAFAWIGGKPAHGLGWMAWLWAREYDGGWFLRIAQHGYTPSPHNSLAAFFPLFPMLTRLLTPLCLGKAWVAALLVSNLALLAALIILYRLTDHEFGRAPGNRAVFYLVAFPTGFFLTAAYNEGLFIALCAAGIYAMRRSHWWVAGIVGAFATATRAGGVLLIFAFAFEYVRQHGRRPRISALAVALMPIGLATVMIADQAAYGDPLAFSHAQRDYWGRELTLPWTPIVATIKRVYHDTRSGSAFGEIWDHNVLELGTVLLLLLLLILMFVGPWRVRRDQL